MRSILATLIFVAIAHAISYDEIFQEEWKTFKLEFDKSYADDVEEIFRYKIYKENKYYIAKHNQLYATGMVSFKLEVNQFADLLSHEFTDMMNGYNATFREESINDVESITFMPPEFINLPATLDWRTKGAVTEVKYQSHCGSCWAFSATGALEGQHFRKSGVLVSLSEQNLVDCSGRYGNHGCQGGWMDNAFRYIKENGGIDTEKSYPYKAINDKCHFNRKTIGATDRGFADLAHGSEQALMQAVATVGPIAVAIDASHKSIQFYKHGVYDEPHCSTNKLNHGVLVVGYGTESNGRAYWLVKNSWSKSWGENGYIKMSRNKSNQCGIATAASYPLV